MADISKITIPAGTYNIKDATARNGAEYIRGTWTAATNAWTGVTRDATLEDGKEIVLYLPFAGTSTATTLNLTLSGGGTTGAKNVYFNSTTRHTTHYGQHQIVRMTYHKSHSIGGTAYEGWWMDAARDTNDNYRDTPYYYYIKPYTALYRYMICFTKNETTVLPVNAVSNSTATTKTLTTEEFDPFGPIFFYNSTTTVATTSYIGANTLVMNCWGDLRYSFNCGNTLTNNKAVYIVCSPQSNGKVKLHSSPLTQTLPTTEDGLVYIFLGVCYGNGYSVQMTDNHPVYYYKGGALRLWSNSYDANTTYSAGTGLSLSGTKFNHSNSVTAQNTQAVYPIKIDAQGHISAYGSAVTIPSAVTESTVSGWGFTKNAGTVTSVRVQATSPITSSQNTAQTGTLNTTIAHANSGVTAGSYGSATAVPVITVNATGHITAVSTKTPSVSVTINENTEFNISGTTFKINLVT